MSDYCWEKSDHIWVWLEDEGVYICRYCDEKRTPEVKKVYDKMAKTLEKLGGHVKKEEIIKKVEDELNGQR